MLNKNEFEEVQSHDPAKMSWGIRIQVLTSPLFVHCDLADGEAVAREALGLEVEAN